MNDTECVLFDPMEDPTFYISTERPIDKDEYGGKKIHANYIIKKLWPSKDRYFPYSNALEKFTC